MYDGVFGANVHYFISRVYVGSHVRSRERPNFFLASATLSAAPEFAANLLSVNRADIIHIQDSTKQQVDLVAAKDLPRLLEEEPRHDCISRFVLVLDDQANSTRVDEFMCQQNSL
jgi:ATP-dependent helicase YprA (DUF1998 family)